MPKMKSNRLMRKKFRVTASGKVKHARANTSHNTGKKSSKRMRQLQGTVVADRTGINALRRAMPYLGIK